MEERRYSSLNNLNIVEDTLREGANDALANKLAPFTEEVFELLSKGVKEIIKRQGESMTNPLEAGISAHRKIADFYEYAAIIVNGRDDALAAKFMEGTIKHRFECVTLQMKLAQEKK